MPQQIFFDQIPNDIRKPGHYFEYNNKLAVRGLPNAPLKLLIIGQKTSSGSVAEAVPTKVFSLPDVVLASGMGSMVYRMAKAAYFANPNINLTIVNLSDHGSGVAASGTLTFTGPATSAGLLTYKLDQDRVEVPITNGMTAVQAAAALLALLATRTELPVSGAVGSNPSDHILTVTARNKGTLGNQIQHSITCTASGLACAVVAFASGATDPDLDTALTSVFAVKYDRIVSPYNNLTNRTTLMTYSGSPVAKLKAHLQNVSGPLEQRRSMAVIAQNAGLSLTTTLATSANYERICFPYIRGSKMWPCEIAAAFAATWLRQPDPAMPLNGMEVRGVDVPLETDWLSRTEQETLLGNGVTPLEVAAGETVRIVRAITTYLVNSSSTPDLSYLDVTTLTSLDFGDLAIRTRLGLRFSPAKGTARVIKDVRSEVLAVMYDLEAAEIWRNIDTYKGQLAIEESTTPGRWNMAIPSPVVPGLHVLAAQLMLFLSPA